MLKTKCGTGSQLDAISVKKRYLFVKHSDFPVSTVRDVGNLPLPESPPHISFGMLMTAV